MVGGGGVEKEGAEVRGPDGPSLRGGMGRDRLPLSAEARESERRGS